MNVCSNITNNYTIQLLTLMQAWTLPLGYEYGDDQATIIQLCPWYLEEMAAKTYQTLDDLGTNGALGLSTSLFVNKQNPNAKRKLAMDTVMLFDGTLLHELTHAYAARNPPPTKDISWGGHDAYRKIIEFSWKLQSIANLVPQGGRLV